MTQAGPKKLLKMVQNCSNLPEIAQNASQCLKMGQQVSKHHHCLDRKNIPTTIEGEGGGGGGQNQPVEFHFFLLANPGIVIQPLKWNCKVTFRNKPWALVRKYLRLAPEELSTSMMTAAHFFGGCHPYTFAASV